MTEEPGREALDAYSAVVTRVAAGVELAQDNNPTPGAAEHSRTMWASMLEGVRTLSEAR